MDYVKNIEIRKGVDVGYHDSNIEPLNRERCVGKSGIDKTLILQDVLNLAYKIDERPNIIIKAGPNAKWYLKRSQQDRIEDDIKKQNWRDTSRCIMYIIDWDE
jgi:hypothetical protein